MPTNHTAKKLASAIDKALEQLRNMGAFDPFDVARVVIEDLGQEAGWPAIRDALVLESIARIAKRRIKRGIHLVEDSRQGWLALPEYQHIPQLIEISGGNFVEIDEATLDQYRESETDLAKRIQSYECQTDKRLKRDKQTLAQMRKLDRQVSPFMAGSPEMKVGHAIALHLAQMETPRARHSRLIASKGGTAKNR